MRSPNGDDDWWRRLSESEVDPISHASLSSLPYPPFNLGTDESHATYFDGFVLSNYLVSTGSFIHPISRRAITRDECKQLDACQREHRLGYAGVLYAFDHPEEYYLYQSEDESDDVEDDPEEEYGDDVEEDEEEEGNWMCVLCDEEEDPFVEDQAKEERSLVPGYMYGNMYGYEGSDQEYNSSEEFENFLNQPVHVDNGP